MQSLGRDQSVSFFVGLIFLALAFSSSTFVVRGYSETLLSEYGQLLTNADKTITKADSAVFVGDVLLARAVERDLALQGAYFPYRNVTNLLAADVVFGNFESAIPEIHVPTRDFNTRFSVDPQYVDDLKAAGFTHLSLANNHAFDFGVSGYNNTNTSLTDHGFEVFGHPYEVNQDSASYIKLNNETIAVVGLHAATAVIDMEALAATMEKVEESSSKQVAYIHWGTEYQTTHSLQQEQLATELVAMGFDLIIGHHPHVTQDIGRIGDVVVVYSLGNFIFDQYFSQAVQQGLALSLEKSGGKFVLNLLPVSSERVRHQPEVLTGAHQEHILNSLAANSDSTVAAEIKTGTVALNWD